METSTRAHNTPQYACKTVPGAKYKQGTETRDYDAIFYYVDEGRTFRWKVFSPLFP